MDLNWMQEALSIITAENIVIGALLIAFLVILYVHSKQSKTILEKVTNYEKEAFHRANVDTQRSREFLFDTHERLTKECDEKFKRMSVQIEELDDQIKKIDHQATNLESLIKNLGILKKEES